MDYEQDDGVENDGDDVMDEDGASDEPLLIDQEFPPDNMIMSDDQVDTGATNTPIVMRKKGGSGASGSGNGINGLVDRNAVVSTPSKTQQKSSILTQLNQKRSPHKLNDAVATIKPSSVATGDLFEGTVGHNSNVQRNSIVGKEEASGAGGLLGTLKQSNSNKNTGLSGKCICYYCADGYIPKKLNEPLKVEAAEIEEITRIHRQLMRDESQPDSKILLHRLMGLHTSSNGSGMVMKAGMNHESGSDSERISFGEYVRELDELLSRRMQNINHLRESIRPHLNQL